MRQAVLITAYSDMEQLRRLVEWFDDDFELFVHLDRRCRERSDFLWGRGHVHAWRQYAVEWGDWRHLWAIVMLMRRAYAVEDLGYFHLITGSDWPCMSAAGLKEFAERNREVNYVEHFALPHADWGADGGLDRVGLWWLRPNTTRSRGANLTRRLLAAQRRLGLRRGFGWFGGAMYGGSTYWSVSRSAVGAALDFMDAHPAYLRRFAHTSIAEEVCLPTLWAGLGVPMVADNRRYIDWGEGGWAPQVLGAEDYERVARSGALFCRKVQSGVSDGLTARLGVR